MGSFFTTRNFQGILQSFLNQGFSQYCCCCDRPANQVVCIDCWRQILACQHHDRSASSAPNQPMLVWGQYQGLLKRAIAQLKYQDQPALASLLGEELGLRWLQTFPHLLSFQVIPIPLHRERLAQRGYNQAGLIAKRFAQVVGVPCVNQGLMRVRETQAQHRLSPTDRQLNIQGAFSIGPALQRKRRQQPVLLIDDIFTTGTTVTEAQRVLELAQFKVLGTAVIAQALGN